VTVNELALPALCSTSRSRHRPRQSSRRALHLSLRRLLRRPPAWAVTGCDVFVCENPNIVAIAADCLGSTCAPLVCTTGCHRPLNRRFLHNSLPQAPASAFTVISIGPA